MLPSAMDGVHDLGGMQGFGAVVREPTEPVFHDTWEARVFGIAIAMLGQGGATVDEVRHAIERMDPAHYLSSSYYEHWLDAIARLAVEKGVLGRQEIDAREREMVRNRRKRASKTTNPDLARALAAGIHIGAPSVRATDAPARFRVGDPVRVRRMHPAGHTRCPRYVRGTTGRIERHHGAHVFPDAAAHGNPNRADHLYTVGFAAEELWGAGEPGRGRVYVDLWESYLEGAE